MKEDAFSITDNNTYMVSIPLTGAQPIDAQRQSEYIAHTCGGLAPTEQRYVENLLSLYESFGQGHPQVCRISCCPSYSTCSQVMLSMRESPILRISGLEDSTNDCLDSWGGGGLSWGKLFFQWVADLFLVDFFRELSQMVLFHFQISMYLCQEQRIHDINGTK